MMLSFSEEVMYVFNESNPFNEIKSQAIPYKTINSAVCTAHCHCDDIMR